MYALFLLYSPGWQLHDIVQTEVERDHFIEMANDLIKTRLLGRPVLGYDIHELKSQYAWDKAET